MDTVIIKCIFCIEYICKLWPMWTAVVKCRWTLLYLRGYCHTFTLPKTLEVIAYINSTGSLLHQAQGQWSWLPPCTFQIFIFSKKYWIKKINTFCVIFFLSLFLFLQELTNEGHIVKNQLQNLLQSKSKWVSLTAAPPWTRPISEATQVWSRLILGWETAWEWSYCKLC